MISVETIYVSVVNSVFYCGLFDSVRCTAYRVEEICGRKALKTLQLKQSI